MATIVSIDGVSPVLHNGDAMQSTNKGLSTPLGCTVLNLSICGTTYKVLHQTLIL